MSIVSILDQLTHTNSLKDKQAILEANKDNEMLKWILEANLNPYKLYQFNKMPCEFEKEHEPQHTQEWKFDFLKGLIVDLEKRHVTGNKAKEAVCAVFKLFDKEHFGLYTQVLLKGPIGVGTTTVNKVWPNLIPEFDLMLAPNKLPNLTQLKYPAHVQPKLDGYRCIFQGGQLYSRTGRPFGNANLVKYFDKLENIDDVVLDGELYVHGISFQNLTKILNKENAPIPKGLKYVVYDCIPTKAWTRQSCKMVYNDRLTLLRSTLNDVVADYSKVIDIATDEVEDAAQVIELYKDYLKKGYEGVMIKDSNGLYQWKRVTLRSAEMVKLKPFKSMDVKIEGFYEGEGKNKGLLGGIYINNAGVAVAVGSGFTGAHRKEIWEDQASYLGKTVEIQYFEETEDHSLRFPTFKRFRPEKD